MNAVSFQLAEAVLSGGSAREFITSLTNPQVKLLQMGFFKGRQILDGQLYGKRYPRPASMSTPYAWGDMILSVQVSKRESATNRLYEIGLCTMGQFGADYPDIWLGQFLHTEVLRAVSAAMAVLDSLPPDVTYDQLDKLLRNATAGSRI